ncbi:MAG: hypothetical protein COB88_08770 [Flavobacteriales bacterium]|nr:MAG: hypothetical protein COB88_08770 [Flavobacteriales bacterium]
MNPLTLVQKVFLLLAGLSGAMSVALGALASHWLKDKLNYWELNTFETGVRYQMYHTLALLGIVIIMNFLPSKMLNVTGFLFIGGIALFSGSLYLLSVKVLLQMPSLSALGPVTPLGGLAFILGWIFLALAVITTWE